MSASSAHALDGFVNVTRNSNWSFGTRDLHLVVCIAWLCHELGESWSPKYTVIGAFEVDNLEAHFLLSVVGFCTESYLKSYPADWRGFLP